MAGLHIGVKLSDSRDVVVLLIQQVNLRLNSLHVLSLCGARRMGLLRHIIVSIFCDFHGRL